VFLAGFVEAQFLQYVGSTCCLFFLRNRKNILKHANRVIMVGTATIIAEFQTRILLENSRHFNLAISL